MKKNLLGLLVIFGITIACIVVANKMSDNSNTSKVASQEFYVD